jgi:hypothetical protein
VCRQLKDVRRKAGHALSGGHEWRSQVSSFGFMRKECEAEIDQTDKGELPGETESVLVVAPRF